MLEFKKIELDDIEVYNEFTANSTELACENSFVNLLIWQCTYNNMMAVKDGQLIIKSGAGEKESFRLPFGDDFEKGIALINEFCGDKKPKFWIQEGERLERFKALFGKDYSFTENRDAFDYIYLQTDLAELSGKKYHSKRNHISAFSKAYDWKYVPIDKSNIEDIKNCADLWYEENGERMDSYMMCEKRGVGIILDNMERLNLNVKGGAIYVDGRPVAFTLGSPINSTVFDIHIEKALGNYATAYTLINREFAKNELGDYKYINREDDLGLEGLRKAKLSYKPHILLKKYSCRGEES